MSDVVSLAVVVIGDFAPGMFHPSWFERLKLFGKNEVEIASKSEKILVSSAQTIFSISGFEIQVHESRFQVSTSREDLHQPLIDLLTSVLSILDSTPVKAVGINWTTHIRASSLKQWHAFGDKMAPKEFWKTHWDLPPGMRNLQMQLDKKDDKGVINVSLEPSSEVKPGIFARVNDHYDFNDMDAVAASNYIKENLITSKITAETFFDAFRKELSHE